MAFDGTTSDSTAQSLLLLLVVVAPLVVVAAGLVTGLKGRSGWLLAGLLLAGVPWLGSAWLRAEPGSWWARRLRTPPTGRRRRRSRAS